MRRLARSAWQEEQAAKFYVSVFPNSEIKSANPMSTTIIANGTEILMFNGGPHFTSRPASRSS